ncbi:MULTISPECIES: LysR family transcriptional regulator [Micrococcaceae]|uniref:LysR family transcriptional regulator n=1 Tax=Micrococcaceae TaxID=1268 RepID=UPI001036C918|nr:MULTISPECIES: LysR family transcriptional regulator [Micrococcaceae]TAP28186.1 LysR family transcriptional regulator [Arthrobacter sp. S41]UXN33010.1 LysR family transcriptional regulator [Glutamicibacter sp. M10]
MDRQIDYRHLESLIALLTVARLGRYTAAAAVLGVNHSTISRRIDALQKAMGGHLLTQTPNGWELTDLGRHAMASAEAIEQAVAAISTEDDSPALAGHVRLAAPDAFSAHLAAPALAKLQARHPQLVFEIVSETTRARQTRTGMDLEIVIGQPNVRKAASTKLMDYELRLYATAEYLEVHGTPQQLSELARHSLNYYIDTALTVDKLDEATSHLPPMRRAISSTSIAVQYAATMNHAGLGLLPVFLSKHYPNLIPVLHDQFSYLSEYWLVGREEALRSKAVQATVRALNDAAANGDWFILPFPEQAPN